MAVNIGPKIGIDGESQFRKEIAAINNEMKRYAAEARAVTAAYEGQEDSLEALTAKSASYKKQLDAQEKAVAKVEEILAKVREKFGDADEATQRWESKLVQARAELLRLQNQLDQNNTKQREFSSELNTTEQEVDGLNSQLKALAAESKAVDAAYEGQERSSEALAKKSEILQKKIQLQTEAVSKLESGLNLAREAYGETDERTLRWQTDLADANAELSRMKSELDKTRPSLKEFANTMDQAGQKLNAAGNALTVGVTTPLIAAGAAAVNYASDTEESMNKVQVAFGDAAQSVIAWSDSTLTSIGLARGTALDMAALYGDMATSMGYSQESAAEMSKTLVNLAADLASFKNISIDEANTALKSIFTGETESLKNLGVVMTQVNLESYAMSKGITKSYQEMSQAEQVQLRYNYVLDKTKNAQGDFARTSDGTANQLRILQESLKEAAATAGEDLLPTITPVITRISELTQSFADLDDETRQQLVQTGLWLAMLGPALKLTGGITSTVSAGVTAYQALKSAQTAATAAQTGLNVAMSANPIGAVITAVGGLVAVLGSFAAASALAGNSQKDLNKELAETEERRLESISNAEAELSNTLAMVTALEELSAVEEKSVAQKQAMAGLVERLNEAMPQLNLAYDQQTDSLNMTADAIRSMAEAEAYRAIQQENMDAMVEQYRIRIEAEQNLATAQANLMEVQRKLSEAQAEAEEQVRKYGSVTYDLQVKIQDLSSQESDLNDTIRDQNGVVDQATVQIDALADDCEDLTNVMDDTTGATDDLTGAQEDQTDAADELRDSSLSLANAADTLTKALQEQESAGSLSLQTTLDLIDAGYAAALSIDSETGAVTLNKDTYIKLAQSKIDAQIAAVEEARASAEAYTAHLNEAMLNATLAESYYELAEAKAAAEDEVKSYDAQIAALKQLKSSLGSYTGAVRTAYSTSSKAASKTVTQAEKNLDKYQEIRDELDYMLAMGQITEEAYYTRLAEIRDQYLTDDENIDEYRKINEEIYQYDQELAEQEDKLWAEQTQALTDELQNRLEEVVGARDDMAEKLGEYGDLFTMEDDIFQLGDLQSQIDTLNQYEEILNRLRERGISDSLLGEVTDMELEDAINYGQQLLGLSDEQWEEYNQLWEEKQARAIEIATKFYEDQLTTLKTEYDEKLGKALDELEDTAYGSGLDTAQSLADGINDNAWAAIQAAEDLANQIAAAMNSALDINSPSGVTEETGRYTAQGFEVGYVDEMRDIRDRMTRSTSTADAANQAAAGVVNGLAGLMPSVQGGTYEIHVNIDGREAATALFDPLNGIIKQRGKGFG